MVGVFAGILIGGETWGWYTVVGLFLTVTGIFISSLEGNKKEKVQELSGIEEVSDNDSDDTAETNEAEYTAMV